jgi:hypothetical protein
MTILVICGLLTSGALLTYGLYLIVSAKPVPVTNHHTLESYAAKYHAQAMTQEEIEHYNRVRWDD